ncbi:MAG TPA: DUF2182 domain-containing protein [Sphingomicrobium sp.]|nr:DUF2182 domain-containing protein [Sphingomicrobium sp.]
MAAIVAALIGLSWWFLINGGGLGDHSAMAMPGMAPPLPALVLMWWLMMMAMMLPSAAPAILLYARVRGTRGGDVAQTWIFAAGYLAIWLLFSLIAAVAQQVLTGPSMALDSALAQGIVLVAAGIYQLTPLKAACLRQCRSPAHFISRHWRAGALGAARLGTLHGAYCVGCCWLLMAVLFVGGVMNFAWIALLTALVAAEKLVPGGDVLGRAAGVGFIAWGIAKLAG